MSMAGPPVAICGYPLSPQGGEVVRIVLRCGVILAVAGMVIAVKFFDFDATAIGIGLASGVIIGVYKVVNASAKGC